MERKLRKGKLMKLRKINIKQRQKKMLLPS